MRPSEIRCHEQHPVKTSSDLHLGWVFATKLLLTGMERLRRRESGEVVKNEKDRQ